MRRPFGIPTLLPTTNQGDKLRESIRKSARVAELWEPIRRQALRALSDIPSPLREIVYEGRLDNDPQRMESVRHLQDMLKLDLLTQAHVVTGEAKYADKAREFTQAWMETYLPTGNPINENKLVPVLIAHAGQRSSVSTTGRSPGDDRVRRMADAEIASAQRSPDSTRNNWHTKRLLLVGLAGITLQEARYIDYAVTGSKRYVNDHLRPDGSSFDFEQRDALGYHIGGITPLLRLAALLMPTGFDLYAYDGSGGASIRKSVEFVVPYARGAKTHVEFANTTVRLDRERAAAGLEHYRPGRVFDPKSSLRLFEMASAFDAQYSAIAATLAGMPGERYPTWDSVLAQSGWLHDSPEL